MKETGLSSASWMILHLLHLKKYKYQRSHLEPLQIMEIEVIPYLNILRAILLDCFPESFYYLLVLQFIKLIN